MALTKAQAALLTQDLMLRGVIETVVMESEILNFLPFMSVVGTAVTYNRELVMPAATFYDVGDTWTEATPTTTQVTAALKILGGDADVDNFLQQTYANPNDLAAEVLISRSKSVAHKFSETFVYGDDAVDAKSFDGLNVMYPIGGSQTLTGGANGGALTLDLMDQLIDTVKPGRPNILFMSKRSRRKLSSLRRASGNLLETDRDEFGLRALFYDGIRIVVDDFQLDNEVKGTSGAVTSSVYALKTDGSGVRGLENGGIVVDPIGDLETKDAKRYRTKWYCGLALMSTLAGARLEGLTA